MGCPFADSSQEHSALNFEHNDGARGSVFAPSTYYCARSSVGQSIGFRYRRPGVRILPSAPSARLRSQERALFCFGSATVDGFSSAPSLPTFSSKCLPIDNRTEHGLCVFPSPCNNQRFPAHQKGPSSQTASPQDPAPHRWPLCSSAFAKTLLFARKSPALVGWSSVGNTCVFFLRMSICL